MHDDDPFYLQRFVKAQDRVIDDVRAELKAGRKTSHWIWFIFPQIQWLGYSAKSRLYAINSAEEARAYLAHPLLGPRLIECTRLMLAAQGRSAEAILGDIDELKFRSCMTLFAETCPEQPVFAEALDKFFGGVRDPATLERL